MAVYYSNLGLYQQGYDVLREAYDLLQVNYNIEDDIDLLDGLSLTTIHLGRLNETENYLKKAENLLNGFTGDAAQEQGVYLAFNKALYARKLGQWEKCERYFNRCIKQATDVKSRKVTHARIYLTKLYMNQGRWEASGSQLRRARHFYSDSSVLTYSIDPYLIEIYQLSAQYYLHQNQLKKALIWVEKSLDIADYYYYQYRFVQSKFSLGDINRKTLELGVTTAYRLFKVSGEKKYAKMAILYADQAKSTVLEERLETTNRIKTNVPDSLVKLRYLWTSKLINLEKKGVGLETMELRNKIDSLDHSLAIDYSVMEKPVRTFSIGKVQNQLDKNQCILTYFSVDTSLYVFQITQEQITVSQQLHFAAEDCFAFYQLGKDPESSIDDFTNLGFDLYQKLIPPQCVVNSAINNLIIIPDQELNYVIFDLLQTMKTNENKWSSLPYMLHSMKSWLHLATRNHLDYDYTYAGFAPEFETSKDKSYLKNSVSMVEGLGKTYGQSISVIKENATILNFQNTSGSAEILHLYTHSVAEDSSYRSSYIHFSDKRMYVDEIMSLTLDNKICVLTACEVGLGRFYDGEGLTGISWAFTAAGSQNVIQSMWKLNDLSSFRLTEDYFEQIHHSTTFTSALNQTKLNYLQNDTYSERLKHPYYWGGINLYGSGGEGLSRTNGPRFIGLISLTFILISLLIVVARLRLNRQQQVKFSSSKR